MYTARIDTYIDTFLLVQRLKKRWKYPEEKPELISLLIEIANRLEKEPESGEPFPWMNLLIKDMGFLPFYKISSLGKDFRELSKQFEKGYDTVTNTKKWKEECFADLKKLIAEFNSYFEEVAQTVVFVPFKEEEHLQDTLENFWPVDDDEMSAFGFLPRISQNCFRDSALCITYGVHRPALSLAVQALESTIRYFYKRLISNQDLEWWDMLDQLSQKPTPKRSYIPLSLKNDLNEIRTYRNLLAHGRAIQSQFSQENIKKIFEKCWQSAQNLIFEIRPTNPQVNLCLKVNNEFTFDVAVALYLYYCNFELPILSYNTQDKNTSHRIIFVSNGIGNNQLMDRELDKTFTGNEKKSVSQEVMEYIMPQEEFSKQIQALVSFTGKKREEADIADDIVRCFEEIRREKKEPSDVLRESRRMFNIFSYRRSLIPEDGAKLRRIMNSTVET